MIGKGLRSGVHCCCGFFKREGEKNLQRMQGKELRSLIHRKCTDIGDALSFLLTSPFFPPDNFHLANPLPVVLNRKSKSNCFINGYGKIAETNISTPLGWSDFRTICDGCKRRAPRCSQCPPAGQIG